jgi:hypothetical protein
MEKDKQRAKSKRSSIEILRFALKDEKGVQRFLTLDSGLRNISC